MARTVLGFAYLKKDRLPGLRNIIIIQKANKLLYSFLDNTPQDTVLRKVSKYLHVFSNSLTCSRRQDFPQTNATNHSMRIGQAKQEKSGKEILPSQELTLIVVAQGRRVSGVSLELLAGISRIKFREQYRRHLARQSYRPQSLPS
jgi:hypothetical protein